MKFSLCKCESLNWDPQQPCISWASLTVPVTPLLGRQTERIPGAGWPAHMTRTVSSRFSLKDNVGPEMAQWSKMLATKADDPSFVERVN